MNVQRYIAMTVKKYKVVHLVEELGMYLTDTVESELSIDELTKKITTPHPALKNTLSKLISIKEII